MAYQVSPIVYPAYTLVYTPSPILEYFVKTSESSKMHSTTTSWVTSSLTLTSYVTASYSASPAPKPCEKDIIGTVQKLPQSVQSYVFEAISDSKCSPCDYACICGDLHGKHVAGKVAKSCTPADHEAYLAFEKDDCSAPSSIIVTPTPYPTGNKSEELTTYTTTTVCPVTTSGKVTTTTSTITVTSCKAYCTAPPAPAPYPIGNNSTSTTTVTSTDQITSTIRVPGESAAPPAAPPASPPAAPPAAPSAAPPAGSATGSGAPVFTGAAVTHAPAVLLAGAVGFFGWVFAEL
ncbi:hypothetical protein G6514_003979 [Epicoccum nigrum]|nr:hypothetical protein G6514_003979 [Epicoccum nigrum]